MDGWMDAWLDAWLDGQMDGMDGRECLHDPMMGKCWEDPRGLTSNSGCMGSTKVQVPTYLPAPYIVHCGLL